MESPTMSETRPLLAESVHVVIAASWLYPFKVGWRESPAKKPSFHVTK
jgi:hypothetical protein